MNAFTLNYDLRQLRAQYESVCNWSSRKGLAFIFHSISEMTAPQPAPERGLESGAKSELVNLAETTGGALAITGRVCRELGRRALVRNLQALTSRRSGRRGSE
ncbi:uncharacterized [Tachysurus ichikawai]